MRCLPFWLILLCGLTGCARLSHYTHLAQGQWQLLSSRVPIERLLADPATPPELAEALTLAMAARRYAIERLGLPDTGSYRHYVQLSRDAVAYNVFATPAYAFAPREVCHLLVGCLAYEGFFDRARAERRAEALAAQGWDVAVAPVPAYSTLGWFRDPLLSTMTTWRPTQMVATIFHELAHERLFVKGDTAFNESYASFVEQEGLRQWLAERGETDEAERRLDQRRRDFVALVLEARERLARAYAEHAGDETALARAKAEGFARLRAEYAALRDTQWGGWGGYDGWFERELNNAHLLPFALYDGWVPAFRALFEQHGGDWLAFHEAAERLGRLPRAEREAALLALMEPRA